MHRFLSLSGLLFLLVGCAAPLSITSLPAQMVDGAQANSIPRWACPTNTPQPYGDVGPVKAINPVGTPDPTTGVQQTKPEYYAIWEQEYRSLGGPPFPAPTPYTKSVPPFVLGQLVNLTADLDVTANAKASSVISGTDRLYIVQLDWRGSPPVFSMARQVALTTIRTPNGRKLLGPWGWSVAAARLAGTDDTGVLRTTAVPARMQVPILAPDGAVDTIELRLDIGGTTRSEVGSLRVQWTSRDEPFCQHPGTAGAIYPGTPRPVMAPPAPADASSLVAWVYQQIGRPYCWGAKGNAPCTGNPSIAYADRCPDRQGLPCWDCSGLMWGAYNALGVVIGHGTANQQNLPLIWEAGSSIDPASVAAPGDLLLFTGYNSNNRPAGSITHVGMYVGDGTMVHAANYPDGVIATPNLFQSRYYTSRLARIVRPNRG